MVLQGLFHPLGVSNTYPDGRILQVPFLPGSSCLVQFDNPGAGGTVFTYGLDGVCHQVSNQVLFPTGATVVSAKGYRLSSGIFGTYGRRKDDWQVKRNQCQVKPLILRPRHRPMSLLYSRARYFLGGDSDTPRRLELLVRALHIDIDNIGYAPRRPNESVVSRVASLNARISSFLEAVVEVSPEDQVVQHLLGVEPGEVVNLIDPELFVFPNPESRPML